MLSVYQQTDNIHPEIQMVNKNCQIQKHLSWKEDHDTENYFITSPSNVNANER